MAAEELQVVRLKDDYYRDGFYKILVAIALIVFAILLLCATSLYLFLSKPRPVDFAVGKEFRVLADVPITQAYLPEADLIQWVSEAVPSSFNLDFIHYMDQIKHSAQYFTSEGWKTFLDILNIYANYNTISNNKLVVTATPTSAPFIINQQVYQGRYSWWVQMSINLVSSSYQSSSSQPLTLQIFVVRVPTLNNLSGVGIQNVILSMGANKKNAQTQ
jgi:intracellular multiplication protein IcmL